MTKVFQFCLLLLLSISILHSCSMQPGELRTAEQLIETDPDSALHILQHLSTSKYKSDQSRALYGLLMIQILDRKHLPLKPDSLLDYSIDYYQNHKDGDKLATSYLFKGRTCKYASQYDKAISYYLKALDEANNSNNSLLLGRIYLDMGDINNIQGDYKVARDKYQNAYTYFKEAKFQPQAFYSLLNIGRTYHESKDYKTAQTYYQKIIPQAKDSLQQGALFQEIGLNFYDFNKFDSALTYFKKILTYPYITYNRATRYCLLSGLYYDLKQYDSAFYYAKNAFYFEIGFRTQRDCYRILTNYEYLKGNMNQMSFYMNKYVALGDSLRKVEAQAKGSYIETTHIAKKEAAKNKYIAWYLGVLALLIFVSSYFLYHFITRRNNKEKLDTEHLHLQQKVEMHKGVLVNHREVLQIKIQERKNLLAPERKKANHADKIAIDRKVYEELLHINDTEFFYDEMNSVLNNLVNKLESRYPTLTPREVHWCCLSLLQISNTDMYMLLDTNVDSLKKMKQRLALKFNLIRVSELENFLISLISK